MTFALPSGVSASDVPGRACNLYSADATAVPGIERDKPVDRRGRGRDALRGCGLDRRCGDAQGGRLQALRRGLGRVAGKALRGKRAGCVCK